MSTTTMSARNKKFWALTQSEKRIAVAKDVIKQITTGLILAKQGIYFTIKSMSSVIETPPLQLDDTFNVIKEKGGKCYVCGVGACFVSLVGLGDKVRTDHTLGDNIRRGDIIHDTQMRDSLRKVFTPQQITLIECAFEMSSTMRDSLDTTNYDRFYHSDFSDSNDLRLKAESFGMGFKKASERLIAIMKNIIANKGTFKP